MANPLFQQMTNQNDIVSKFNQFRQMFRGDPQQQVQQLLNSGKITQEQYNNAVKQANNLRSFFGF